MLRVLALVALHWLSMGAELLQLVVVKNWVLYATGTSPTLLAMFHQTRVSMVRSFGVPNLTATLMNPISDFWYRCLFQALQCTSDLRNTTCTSGMLVIAQKQRWCGLGTVVGSGLSTGICNPWPIRFLLFYGSQLCYRNLSLLRPKTDAVEAAIRREAYPFVQLAKRMRVDQSDSNMRLKSAFPLS